MTRYVGSCFFTVFVLFLWRVGDIADACKCSPPHPQQAFCDAEIVIRAKVVGKKVVSNAIKYDIQQIKMFKCPNQVIHAIFTASSPAACGVTLEINKEYLFTGKLETGRMYVTLCGYNPPWEDLSAAQKNSLTHRYQSGCDCKVCVMGIIVILLYTNIYTSHFLKGIILLWSHWQNTCDGVLD
uniref:Metalloproteinase inhibitor 2 n=1 Tax=Salmo trutta TaxID=8032 RepID=A0A674E725_SALTR